MIERLREQGQEEDIERRQPEQAPASANVSVELFLSQEVIDDLSPTRKAIVEMYREDGNYEGIDTSDQEKDLLKTTRNSRYSAAKATKDEAFADYLGVVPAANAIREGVKQPLIDDQYAKARARIEEKVANLKKQVADFKKETETRYGKEVAKIDRRYEKAYKDETSSLVEAFGPSFADRLAKVNQRRKDIGSVVVTKVEVDSSKSEAQAEIAKSNQEASGVDANQADISLLAGVAGGEMFGDREAREARIAEFQAEQQAAKEIEGQEVEVADDIRMPKALVEGTDLREPQGTITDLEAMDAINSIESKPRKKSIFGRAKDKMNLAVIALTTRNANKSPEEVKSRRRKIAAIGVGALAVGAAYFLTKDNGIDLGLGGIFGSGAENHANDAQNTVATNTGSTGLEGQVFGPEMPEINVQPETPVAPVDVAPTPAAEPANFIQGSKEKLEHFSLASGEHIWGEVEDVVRQNHPNWSEQQIIARTAEETNNVLRQTGETYDSARSLPVGWNTKG